MLEAGTVIVWYGGNGMMSVPVEQEEVDRACGDLVARKVVAAVTIDVADREKVGGESWHGDIWARVGPELEGARRIAEPGNVDRVAGFDVELMDEVVASVTINVTDPDLLVSSNDKSGVMTISVGCREAAGAVAQVRDVMPEEPEDAGEPKQVDRAVAVEVTDAGDVRELTRRGSRRRWPPTTRSRCRTRS